VESVRLAYLYDSLITHVIPLAFFYIFRAIKRVRVIGTHVAQVPATRVFKREVPPLPLIPPTRGSEDPEISVGELGGVLSACSHVSLFDPPPLSEKPRRCGSCAPLILNTDSRT